MPFSFIGTGIRHRRLILRLTWSRLETRYRGTWLGWFWLLAVPLLLLAVYTFVFSAVFQARWGPEAGHGQNAPFSLILFCGLTLFGLFSECVNEAPTLMHSYQAHLKQLLFPSEVLAWVCLLAAGVRLCASLALLFLAYTLFVGVPPVESLLVLVVLVPIALMTLGAIWLLSSLGVFLRDLSHATAVVTSALLFLSPIFYPASQVPEAFRSWFWLNPMTPPLEAARQALFEGRLPVWGPLLATLVVGLLVAWVGHAWFIRSKGGFVDVL